MAVGRVPTDGAGTGCDRAPRPRRACALYQARDCATDCTTMTALRARGDRAHAAAMQAAGKQQQHTTMELDKRADRRATALRGGRGTVTGADGWTTVVRARPATRSRTAMASAIFSKRQ